MMSEINEHPGMTPEEIAAMEAQRAAEWEARLAPFRAFRQRHQMSFRASVRAGSISSEELLESPQIFPEHVPGMDLKPGDVVRSGDKLWKTIQGHKTQADWAPGPATAALFVLVETTANGEPVDPENPPATPLPWQAGVAYLTGDERADNGATYICLQGHTSQVGWEPHSTPSLWQAK